MRSGRHKITLSVQAERSLRLVLRGGIHGRTMAEVLQRIVYDWLQARELRAVMDRVAQAQEKARLALIRRRRR